MWSGSMLDSMNVPDEMTKHKFMISQPKTKRREGGRESRVNEKRLQFAFVRTPLDDIQIEWGKKITANMAKGICKKGTIQFLASCYCAENALKMKKEKSFIIASLSANTFSVLLPFFVANAFKFRFNFANLFFGWRLTFDFLPFSKWFNYDGEK